MTIHIIGSFNKDTLYCAGSFTKLLTTFVSLSHLAEKYDLSVILDDDLFLDKLCDNAESKSFLQLFQKIIGSKFTIRDLCSFYSGLPYTFDLGTAELASVEKGNPFKHHSILDEKTFLNMCQTRITTIIPNRCKFHYSEIAIIFLGYLLEKVFQTQIEDSFQKFVLKKFNLTASQFSRVRPKDVYTQDLSDKYDYPSIAILDHGYFCYSNGFYTTLNDMKKLIENILQDNVFQFMVDIKNARAASPRLLNGLTIEMRIVGDDLIYGYEGLSFSGCNIWNYSTARQEGFITFTNSEENAYPLIYNPLGYMDFDKVPNFTQKFYARFIANYQVDVLTQDLPEDFRGNYHRVKINEKDLEDVFVIGKDFIVIRNPDEIRYETMFVNEKYHVQGKDKIQSTTVSLYEAESGNRYMLFDGTLYRKIDPA
jgi:CubicO group peptidase (beta-lactamase class C family)